MLLPRDDRHSPLTVPIGFVDCPFEQRRDPLVAELAGAAGNIAVVGAPRSGKSTALRTLVMALATTHSPSDVQFYCLDFGGGALSSLRSLPHVGSVAGTARCRPVQAHRRGDGVPDARTGGAVSPPWHRLDGRLPATAGRRRPRDRGRPFRRRVPRRRRMGHAAPGVRQPRRSDHCACRSGSFVRCARRGRGFAVGGDAPGAQGPDRNPHRTAARRPCRLRDGPQAGPAAHREPARTRHHPRWARDGDCAAAPGRDRGRRGPDPGGGGWRPEAEKSMGRAVGTSDRTSAGSVSTITPSLRRPAGLLRRW